MIKIKNQIKGLLTKIKVIWKNNQLLIFLAILVSIATILLLVVMIKPDLKYLNILGFFAKGYLGLFSKKENEDLNTKSTSSEEEGFQDKQYTGERSREKETKLDNEEIIITAASEKVSTESTEWWVSTSEPDYKERAFDCFDERRKAREKEISVNLERVNASGCKPHDSPEILREERVNAYGCKPHDSPEILREERVNASGVLNQDVPQALKEKNQRSPIHVREPSKTSESTISTESSISPIYVDRKIDSIMKAPWSENKLSSTEERDGVPYEDSYLKTFIQDQHDWSGRLNLQINTFKNENKQLPRNERLNNQEILKQSKENVLMGQKGLHELTKDHYDRLVVGDENSVDLSLISRQIDSEIRKDVLDEFTNRRLELVTNEWEAARSFFDPEDFKEQYAKAVNDNKENVIEIHAKRMDYLENIDKAWQQRNKKDASATNPNNNNNEEKNTSQNTNNESKRNTSENNNNESKNNTSENNNNESKNNTKKTNTKNKKRKK